MCECGERHDEYEWRLGYQYKGGEVSHTQYSETEEEVRQHQTRFAKNCDFMLLTGPWLEKRKILRWERVPDQV